MNLFINKITLSAWLLFVSLFVVSCQANVQTSETNNLLDVPFIQKKPDFGGEACIAMFLKYKGTDFDQDSVFDAAGVDPLLGRGCVTKELVAAAKLIGIEPGEVWFAPKAGDDWFNDQLAVLEQDIRRQIPWVVCVKSNGFEKFVLLIGIDQQRQRITYHDPGFRDGHNRQLSFDQLKDAWVLTGDTNSQYIVRMRMDLKTEVPNSNAKGFTNADYAQHVRKLKDKLPEDGFKIVLRKPFVVIGDESQEMVERRATQTVQWAVTRLKERYFSKDPNEILDIWLFKDKESYNRNATKLFGSKPTTPFGYYSSFNKSLVMNISTGGGTLVHEIVHPFIESNFPGCPSWFNEGLASLYEQCSDNDGKIWGRTNWRLRGLQLAIEDNRVPEFAELCQTTRDEFYNHDPGTNYAQARYLCYYLQENDKLVEFYETFRDNIQDDPSGLKSLRKVLDTNDLEAFKKKWERYVLRLRF